MPVSSGWLVHRIYFKDHELRDFAWNLLYTSSASRWIDGYFAVGAEWDDDGEKTTVRGMTETGLKFRGNIKTSPMRFLTKLGPDFWGLRVGIKYLGVWDFEQLGYALEFGAGSW